MADAALAYLSEEELLRELLERVTEILGTDTAAILLLDETGAMLRARAAKGIEEEVERGVQIPVGKGFAGRIAAERRPIRIDDVDHADILNPILREKGIRSLLGVPLLAEDRVLGVLHVGSLVPRLFTRDERDLLQLAADRTAVAIQHAALYEQRRLADASSAACCRIWIASPDSSSPAATCPPAARASAATGTTRSRSPAAASPSPRATWSGTASTRRR